MGEAVAKSIPKDRGDAMTSTVSVFTDPYPALLCCQSRPWLHVSTWPNKVRALALPCSEPISCSGALQPMLDMRELVPWKEKWRLQLQSHKVYPLGSVAPALQSFLLVFIMMLIKYFWSSWLKSFWDWLILNWPIKCLESRQTVRRCRDLGGWSMRGQGAIGKKKNFQAQRTL